MKFTLISSKQVAVDSTDHIFPHGTIKDSTHAPWFVEASIEKYGSDLKFLDLGCAGGGLVSDFVSRGCFAVGLEGSDINQKTGRAEWSKIPNHLKTCDITEDFSLVNQNQERIEFDIISAWDVMEHIPRVKLPTTFANVVSHLDDNGVFTGSISTRPSRLAPDGSSYHKSVIDRTGWLDLFDRNGLVDTRFKIFKKNDYPRGNGRNFPANFFENPELGFHFTAVKIVPKILDEFLVCKSLCDMKSFLIEGQSKKMFGRKAQLEDHLTELRREFSQKPEIVFYHAALVTLIRRNIDTITNLHRFFALWESYSDLLLSECSTRWLVSAADTYSDYSPFLHERVAGQLTSALVNITKLYETERLSCKDEDKTRNPAKTILFDDVTSFSIGHGDMVKNFLDRAFALSKKCGVVGKIHDKIVERLHSYDTIFERMYRAHEDPRSIWKKMNDGL